MLDRKAGPLRYLPLSRFAAFFSAIVLAGFFFVSFFLSCPLPMMLLLHSESTAAYL